MKTIVAIAKALSDPNRVRVLIFLLNKQPLCVCQIIHLLKLAPSTVSKHLSILCTAGLLESQKKDKWVYYQLASKPQPAVQSALVWLKDCFVRNKIIKKEKSNVVRVAQKSKERLCERYRVGR